MKEFNEKFKIKENTIAIVGAWCISLRPAQVTLGSLVLSLIRKCKTMAELTQEETADLALAFKEVERMLDSTFQPNKLNYLALMMVDEQVHFHVIPRYAASVIYNDVEYKDNDWPKPPQLSNVIQFTEVEILSIKEMIKNS